MTTPNDGGPAFPHPVAEPFGDGLMAKGGMSLRAYMATKFMAAMLSNPANYDERANWRRSEYVEQEAVALADDLLNELSK